ncbi:MAG: hypothetical protein QXX72_04675, partial [Desulfurococcaceae archaeon]
MTSYNRVSRVTVRTWRIGLLGFGNVGQGFVRILVNKSDVLRRRYKFDFKVVGIADPVKGSVFDPEGLDVEKLIELVDKYGHIRDYPT